MKNNIKIIHVHKSVGHYNGSICFLVKNKILSFEVYTQDFNSSGEIRMNFEFYANEDYNPNKNKVEPTPYDDFDDIFINEEDLNFLIELDKEINDFSMNLKRNEKFYKKYKFLYEKHENEEYIEDALSCCFYEGDEELTFKQNNKEIKYSELKFENSYERIFYPILNQFVKNYYEN